MASIRHRHPFTWMQLTLQDLLHRLGRGKISVIFMFGFDKTLAEEYAVLSALKKLQLILFLQEYMPLPGRPPLRPANYFDIDIDRIAEIRFRTIGRNNEKFLSFVNQRYFETFGQYYLLPIRSSIPLQQAGD